MKGRKILVFSLAAVLSVGLASCGKKTEKVFDTKVFAQTYSADMYTMDYLNTYHASDSEVLVNLVDGLVEHDTYGLIRPALAESWTKTVNGEGDDVWTFKLREGVKWVNNAGVEYADVTADDFVAGMHHLLDTGWNALGYIVFGVIKNAYEYSVDEENPAVFADVGVKAKSTYEVEYTLEGQVPYFMKMLEYNPFMPLNRAFFLAKGGAFGVAEWAAAEESTTFGAVGDMNSILYNGAFTMTKYASQSVMELTKNPKYWDVKNVTLNSVKYVYDDGSNLQATYQAFKNGEYAGMGISSTLLETARADFPDHIYTTDTNSTTYYGAFNLNRETYVTGTVASVKSEAEKADTKVAVLNKNFRKAVQAAFDRGTWNSVTIGQELKYNNLRNTLTAPDFVSLGDAVGEYAAGLSYGEVVEAEYKKLNPGFTGSLADGQDGFFNATRAAAFKTAAMTELNGQVTFPIKLDVVYYSPSTNQTNQATAFKQSLEATLGTDFVVVNLMAATTTADYYAAGYRAYSGEKSNFDFFYGSGWGPDYGDPLTYLNIFDYQMDMMAVIGIGNADGTYAQDDEDAYNAALGEYSAKLEAAKVLTGSERYVAFAELEAYLLDSAVVNMTTTQGGNYALTRIQPRTVPYVLYGTDNEKLKNVILHEEVLTAAEIAAFKAKWAQEKADAEFLYNFAKIS